MVMFTLQLYDLIAICESKTTTFSRLGSGAFPRNLIAQGTQRVLIVTKSKSVNHQGSS